MNTTQRVRFVLKPAVFLAALVPLRVNHWAPTPLKHSSSTLESGASGFYCSVLQSHRCEN